MEDLINEEEFLPQKDSYNPWKGFFVFYVIAIVYYVVATTISKNMRGTNMVGPLNFIFGGIMVVMPFVMIFRKKKNILLPIKTILSSVCILMTIFFFLNIGEQMVETVFYDILLDLNILWIYFEVWAAMIAYGFVCTLIILAIRWRKLKKLSKPQSSSL
jgi:hypothetical protein